MNQQKNCKPECVDAKEQAQSEYFQDINTKNYRNKIFKIAQAIKDTNKDVTGEKCVCDNKENLTISDESKLRISGCLGKWFEVTVGVQQGSLS